MGEGNSLSLFRDGFSTGSRYLAPRGIDCSAPRPSSPSRTLVGADHVRRHDVSGPSFPRGTPRPPRRAPRGGRTRIPAAFLERGLCCLVERSCPPPAQHRTVVEPPERGRGPGGLRQRLLQPRGAPPASRSAARASVTGRVGIFSSFARGPGPNRAGCGELAERRARVQAHAAGGDAVELRQLHARARVRRFPESPRPCAARACARGAPPRLPRSGHPPRHRLGRSGCARGRSRGNGRTAATGSRRR